MSAHFVFRRSLCLVAAIGAVAPSARADESPGAAAPSAAESTDAPAGAPLDLEIAVMALNGAPVANATIRFPSLNIVAVTRADGVATVKLRPGVQSMEVSAPGFSVHKESMTVDGALAAAGAAVYLTYDLGKVVVTGTTTEKQVEQAPIRTQVIDQAAMERKGSANLAQALKHTTGVRVENNCQNCNFTQVRLNGLDGRYSQILINSRPVFSSLAGVYGLEQIPAEMIDRVEIVKGGGSALYGGAAVAGVINVLTKRPDRNFGSVRAGFHSLTGRWGGHRFGGNVGLVNDSKTLALALSGSLQSREAWDANGDGFSDMGMFRQHSAGAELYWDPIARGTLTLRLQSLGERRRGGDNLSRPEFDSAVSEGGTTLRQGAELRWKHTLRSGVAYELGYTFAHTSRDSYYGGGGDVTLPTNPTPQDWQDFWTAKSAAMKAFGRTRNPVHYGDALVHVPVRFLGETVLTGGAQFQYEKLSDEFAAYSRKVDAHYSDIAGIAEADWHPAEWNETVLGLRVAKHSAIDNVIATPRLATTMKPLPWLNTRTAFSTGYRAPQVFDEDLHITIIGGEGAIVQNASGLKPEQSYSGAQQVEATVALSPTWSWKSGVNGFATYLRDTFVLDDIDNAATPGEREFLRTNRGRTTVYGGEFETSLLWIDAFSLRGGLTLERARNSEADPDFGSKQVLRTPAAYGYVEVSGKLDVGLEPYTALDIIGPMKVPHYSGYIQHNRLETSPWFFDWDVGLAQRVRLHNGPALRIAITGRNLLNSYQRDLDRGPLRDAGYVYGPMRPRSLWFEIKAEM